MREACESQLEPAGSASQCCEGGVPRQPRCTSAGINHLDGWLVLFHSPCRLLPRRQLRGVGTGIRPAAGCSRSASDGSRRVEPGGLSRVLAAPSTGTNRSCADSNMFAPTNARRLASRALFLPRSNSLAAVSPPVPVRRACCSRIGMPCSGTPDIAQGSRSFCGTAECIQDASLDDGCWLVAVSFFPSDPSRTRR